MIFIILSLNSLEQLLLSKHPSQINPFASIGRKLRFGSRLKGHGHLSKYLISGLIFNFFHVYMRERKKKKNFKPFSKKKGLLIYLSSIKTELAINFLKKKKKKKLLYLAENRAGAERVNNKYKPP